jgi:type IV secretory pathway VirB2 component (pilin)
MSLDVNTAATLNPRAAKVAGASLVVDFDQPESVGSNPLSAWLAAIWEKLFHG